MTGHWESAKFGGEGPVKITDDLIRLDSGDPLTGIRWTGEFPKQNYEIEYQARRVDGFDFFATVTFPVGDEHCSFVTGGWGGGTTGISSIDGADASGNDTTGYLKFEPQRWYTIRVRVDESEIVCWIDKVEYARVQRGNHTFDIRFEMDPCLPLGIAAYATVAEIKAIRYKTLP